MFVSMNRECSASTLIAGAIWGGKNCLLQGWKNEAIHSLGVTTVCRGGLLTTWIARPAYEKPISPGFTLVPVVLWGPRSAFHNSDELLHGHPPRPIMVPMELFNVEVTHRFLWVSQLPIGQMTVKHSNNFTGLQNWECIVCMRSLTNLQSAEHT